MIVTGLSPQFVTSKEMNSLGEQDGAMNLRPTHVFSLTFSARLASHSAIVAAATVPAAANHVPIVAQRLIVWSTVIPGNFSRGLSLVRISADALQHVIRLPCRWHHPAKHAAALVPVPCA